MNVNDDSIKDIEIDVEVSNAYDGVKVNGEFLSNAEALELAKILATASSELLQSALHSAIIVN